MTGELGDHHPAAMRFPIPFPFQDEELFTEYVAYLDGDLPSIWHLPLTEAEKAELEAWEESCLRCVEDARVDAERGPSPERSNPGR